MTWQEYQEAVSVLYEQMEGVGQVERNIYIPDQITGQKRQIDTLLTIRSKGHTLRMIIDAKFYASPLDVKDVEAVTALANAVGVFRSVIVAPNGWSEPAMAKSEHVGCDLKILTLEEALDLVVTDKWMMCPNCFRDCVVMDQTSLVPLTDSGMLHWWLGGACRECNYAIAWCQDCGDRYHLKIGEELKCYCGYLWSNDNGEIDVDYEPREEAK